MRFLKPFAVVVCLLAVSGVVRADEFVLPEQKIEGAEEKIEPGDLADIFVKHPKNPPSTLVSTSYDWYVYDITNGRAMKVRQYSEKNQDGVYFGTGLKARRLLVFCNITHLYIVKNKDESIKEAATRNNFLMVKVIIEDPAPTPPGPGPGPGPGPNPIPEPPDGDFGLSKFAFREAYTKVGAEKRVVGARAMAASLTGIAASIAAGTLSDPVQILKQTKTANNTALANVGVSPDEWDSFGLDLQNELIRLRDARSLVTKDDYQKAWKALAFGLQAVK
jgi:hypothetical protein